MQMNNYESGPLTNEVLETLEHEAPKVFEKEWVVVHCTEDHEYDAHSYDSEEKVLNHLYYSLTAHEGGWEFYGLYQNQKPINFSLDMKITLK